MKKSSATLKERLSDWQDVDMAMYFIGACLGFWHDFGVLQGDPYRGTKHIFWSDNILGDTLHSFLMGLVKEGILETNDGEDQFRWNKNYQGDWLDFGNI